MQNVSNAHLQVKEKRKRDDFEAEIPVKKTTKTKRLKVNEHSTGKSLLGFPWDHVNWSCPYDSLLTPAQLVHIAVLRFGREEEMLQDYRPHRWKDKHVTLFERIFMREICVFTRHVAHDKSTWQKQIGPTWRKEKLLEYVITWQKCRSHHMTWTCQLS